MIHDKRTHDLFFLIIALIKIILVGCAFISVAARAIDWASFFLLALIALNFEYRSFLLFGGGFEYEKRKEP